MIDKKIYKEIIKRSKTDSFEQNPCFYLYNLECITNRIKLLEQNLPQNVRLFYSIKANPYPKIIKHISSQSYIRGVEIASLGDLNQAIKYFNPKQIIFTGPGKTPYVIRRALQNNIGLIVVESYLEALRIQKIAEEEEIKKVHILIRLNINYKAMIAYSTKLSSTQQLSGLSSKFGVDEEKLYPIISNYKKLDRLVIEGIHVMSASEQLDYCGILNYFRYVFQLVKKLSIKGLKVGVIDFGGGFGIDYEGKNKDLDILSLGKGFNQLIKEFGFENKVLIFELGKYLVGESGYYVTEIIDIKESRGKKHIITAGGINHNIRPLLADIHYQISIISRHIPELDKAQTKVLKEKVDIGGPLSSSLDTFFKYIYVNEARVGDLIVIPCSGAYSLTMSPINFISHPISKEYII